MQLIKNQKGVTIVEVLVGAFLLAAIVLVGAQIFVDSTKHQMTTEEKSQADVFAGSFIQWLQTNSGCMAAFSGKTIPTSKTPLAVVGFDYFGLTNLPTIAAGTAIGNQSVVQSLDISTKPGVTASYLYGATPLTKRVLQVDLQMQVNVGGTSTTNKTNSTEIPVLVDAAGSIVLCDTELTESTICAAVGGQWNPVTAGCDQVNNCKITGSYVGVRSIPAAYCCGYYTNPGVNPITGARSCPAGSIPLQLGSQVYPNIRTYSCGKKCTGSITDFEDYYVCLDCT